MPPRRKKRTYFGPNSAKASNREIAGHALTRALKALEFKDFAEFLASPLYQWIKSAACDGNNCRMCGHLPHHIHFMRTDIQVFTGRQPKHIAALCWDCLQIALYHPSGARRTLAETNHIINCPAPAMEHTAEDSGVQSADS